MEESRSEQFLQLFVTCFYILAKTILFTGIIGLAIAADLEKEELLTNILAVLFFGWPAVGVTATAVTGLLWLAGVRPPAKTGEDG